MVLVFYYSIAMSAVSLVQPFFPLFFPFSSLCPSLCVRAYVAFGVASGVVAYTEHRACQCSLVYSNIQAPIGCMPSLKFALFALVSVDWLVYTTMCLTRSWSWAQCVQHPWLARSSSLDFFPSSSLSLLFQLCTSLASSLPCAAIFHTQCKNG